MSITFLLQKTRFHSRLYFCLSPKEVQMKMVKMTSLFMCLSWSHFPSCPSSESEDEGGVDGEDEGSGAEDLESACAVCSRGGTLVCCDSCPLMYHLTCAAPPLKKVPKGKWLCQICAGTDNKAGKIKMNLGKGKAFKNCYWGCIHLSGHKLLNQFVCFKQLHILL